jgi:hypothetical protein
MSPAFSAAVREWQSCGRLGIEAASGLQDDGVRFAELDDGLKLDSLVSDITLGATDKHMPQLKLSFIAEIRTALSTSRFTEQDFDLAFPDSGKVLTQITFVHKPEYFIALHEEERVEPLTIEQRLIGTSQTREVRETVNWVRAVPGSVKVEATYDIDEPRSFLREIPKWCENIKTDLAAVSPRLDPLEELRSKLQATIDHVVTDPDGRFSAEELEVVDRRFDKLYEDIEALREQYAFTKQQLEELRSEMEEFKGTARTYTKGIWAKITGNKLVRATGRLVNTPEGRTFLFQQIKRALGMSDDA